MCRFFLQHFHAFPSISFNYTVFVCFLVVWSDSFLHTKIPHRNSIQENVSGLRSNHEYIGFTLPNQLKDEVIGWFPLQPGAKFHRTIWLVGLIRCFFLAWRAYLEGVPQLNKHPINPTILQVKSSGVGYEFRSEQLYVGFSNLWLFYFGRPKSFQLAEGTNKKHPPPQLSQPHFLGATTEKTPLKHNGPFT